MSTDGFTPEMWDEWLVVNPWYGQDAELTECANRLSQRVREERPEPVGLAYYNRVKELVKEQYPDAFAGETEEPPGIPPDESVVARQDGRNGAGLSAGPAEETAPTKPRNQRTRILSEMNAEDFNQWRGNLGLSQRGASRCLGISVRQVYAYTHGEKPIPLLVALACEALGTREEIKKVWQAHCLLGKAFGVEVERPSAHIEPQETAGSGIKCGTVSQLTRTREV